jgi:hypothetical protein
VSVLPEADVRHDVTDKTAFQRTSLRREVVALSERVRELELSWGDN